MSSRPLSLIPALALFGVARAFAVTIHVPADYATIKQGVLAATAGDTVEVACGTYAENDIPLVSRVTLRSASGLPGCVTIDGGGLGRVLVGSHLAAAPVVEGLTVIRGAATGAWPHSLGGALFCEDGSPQISDCVFLQNTGEHGAAVAFLWQGSPRLAHCSFRENVATGNGGAINFWGSDSPSMTNCSFVSNHANIGGAMSADAANLTLDGCTFEQNGAPNAGGAAYVGGATSLRIAHSTFTANSVGDGGGGALYMYEDTTAVIEDCLVQDNTAWGDGGALIWFFCRAGTLRNCRFVHNRSVNSGGGAIRFHFAHATLENSVFWGNAARLNGGVLASYGSTITMNGSTCVGNQANLGGWYSGTFTRVDVSHSIIAFSTGGAAGACDETVFLTCSDVFGNAGGDWVSCIAGESGVDGNMTVDPLFCNLVTGDFGLRSDSPCAPPGVTGCGLVGALPVTCGPIAVQPKSWGSVKALYR